MPADGWGTEPKGVGRVDPVGIYDPGPPAGPVA